MYKNWQESLLEESLHKERHEERRRARREKRERKLMKLQRELQMRQKHEAITLRKSSTATGSSTVGREGCDTTNEASKNDNGRRNSSLDNGSHQDSPSRLSSIMAATASENPPPSHATGDRFNANSVRRPNLKTWAGNVLRGAAPKRASLVINGTVGKESGVSTTEPSGCTPPKILRKSFSSPHLSNEVRKSVPATENDERGADVIAAISGPGQQKTSSNETSGSVPIDIHSDSEEQYMRRSISVALSGELEDDAIIV